MTDAHCLNILNLFKDQKTKSGKFKVRDDNRLAVESFIGFDPLSDWMESKDFTKLCKILASAVLTGSDLAGEPIDQWYNSIPTRTEASVAADNSVPKDWRKTYSHRYGISLYGDVRACTLERQYHLKEDYIDHPEDKAQIETLIRRITALKPIVEKTKAMEKRLTRNGKFPKQEAQRREREAIKGKLDQKLLAALTDVRAEWVEIIFKSELDWRLKLAAALAKETDLLSRWNSTGVPKDEIQRRALLEKVGVIKLEKVSERKFELVQGTELEMKESAQLAADTEGDEFLFKMADKLGGLVTGPRSFLSLEKILRSQYTAFSNFLVFHFSGNSLIRMENKIITNRSVHEKRFRQFPCTFTEVIVDGVRLQNPSEFAVKKAFLSKSNSLKSPEEEVV